MKFIYKTFYTNGKFKSCGKFKCLPEGARLFKPLLELFRKRNILAKNDSKLDADKLLPNEHISGGLA